MTNIAIRLSRILNTKDIDSFCNYPVLNVENNHITIHVYIFQIIIYIIDNSWGREFNTVHKYPQELVFSSKMSTIVH